MKKLTFSLLIILQFHSEIVLSQDKLVISSSQSFQFSRIDAVSGFIISGSEIRKKFWGEYDGNSSEYKLMDSARENVLVTLKSPLNRDELREKLTAVLNKNEEFSTPFSEYSIEKVFIWLYSLNQDKDIPNSGVLNLGRFVKVFEGNFNNEKNRIKKLEQYTNSYQQRQSLAFSNRVVLINKIDSLGNLIKKAPKITIANDGLYQILTEIKMLFEKELLPNLEEHFKRNKGKHLQDIVLLNRSLLLNSLKDSIKEEKILSNNIFDQVNSISNFLSSYSNSRDNYILLQSEIQNEGYLPIEKVSLQFERGNLERIQVWVQNETGSLEIYENIYAIGFTSINNFRSFQKMRLFLRKNPSIENKGIFLSDVLGNYDNLLDLFTRDYSPADTIINGYNPAQGAITLHRAKSINLFETRIYSDLQGINPDQPNGLVQIEISRRFNIHTVRYPSKGRTDFGFLSYFNIYGAITKIEENQRHLYLRNKNQVINNQIVSPSYVSNLDLRRFENAVVGLDLNGYLFDFPDAKFTAYLDFGIRYGHISMVEPLYTVSNGIAEKSPDSVHFPAHTISLSIPKLTLEFFSERRVGFNLSYAFHHTYAFTGNRFKQVMSYEKSNLYNRVIEPAARKSHMAELNIRIETNKSGNGQLFFRNRFFWQHRDTNTFFVQSQVGYWYNIIFRK